MTIDTIRLGRVFTRGDGRERVSIPFWAGLLATIAAIAIGIGSSLIATFALVFGTVLAFGTAPSTQPGHLVEGLSELIFYAAGGWFAWHRLSALRGQVFRRLDGGDVRALLFGIGALLLVKIGAGFQLAFSHQTTHVQSGFEHFSVVSRSSTVTAIAVALAVLTMVVIGPLIEEVIFRGLFFGALSRPFGVLAAAAISSLLFGGAHADPVLFPSLAALGFIASIAYATTGNLAVPVLLHALNNAVGATFLIAAGLQTR